MPTYKTDTLKSLFQKFALIFFKAEGDEEAGSQVLKLGKALFKPKKGT